MYKASATKEAPNRQIVGLSADAPPVRALVADNNQANRDVLNNMLSRIGFQVKEASDGLEAVNKCRDWEPHLVLIDLVMPKMGGHEAIQSIRQSYKKSNPPVIIAVTASVLDEDRTHVLSLGAEGLLTKPFREADLFDMIAEHLDIPFEYAEKKSLEEALPRSEEFSMQQIQTALANVPLPWLRKMQKALHVLDTAQMLALLQACEGLNKQIAGGLRTMIEAYEFERLETLIGEVSESDG
jgi:CheY-like chemotaxis protein